MDRYSYFNESMTSLDNIIDVFHEETPSQTDLLKRILKYAVYMKMAETDTSVASTAEASGEEEHADE